MIPTTEQLTKNLRLHLNEFIKNSSLLEMASYSCFPAGKLIRPSLAHAAYIDFNYSKAKNIEVDYFASALEIHHTYSLIHDDLPAMDNDTYRRGRLTSHKQFGEANAILTGDALLSLSFAILSKLPNEKIPFILKLFHRYLGADGLILGQYLDLSLDKKFDYTQTLHIHRLKTSRLFQVAIIGGAYLAKPLTLNNLKVCYFLGDLFGQIFQLLDDYLELKSTISKQEEKINIFIQYPDLAKSTLKSSYQKMMILLEENKMSNCQFVIENLLTQTGVGKIDQTF